MEGNTSDARVMLLQTERSRAVLYEGSIENMNPVNLVKLKPLLQKLGTNHPEVVKFGKSLYPDAVKGGTVITVDIATSDGKKYDGNVKLDDSDAETVQQIIELLS